ncbi:MAG TPA: hypothetical protein VJ600_02295 [Holophagaceae bacterium]|nr:hypothetical protein [Holophagaceae bacterium]
MRTTTGTLQMERIQALEGAVWGLERFLMDAPAELQELSELFPGDLRHVDSTHPIDLDLLNSLIRPRGFLATWEPEGLLFFRLRL